MAAGHSAVDEMPEEEINCLVLGHLTRKVGIKAIRTSFDRMVPPASLTSLVNSNRNKLKNLLQRKIMYPAQLTLLFPQAGTVTSEDFDMTLMVCLIRNILHVTPPTTGWDILPNPTDLTEEADIARIKYYHNNFLAHLQSAELSNPEFNKAATDVREAISRLSNTSLDAEVQKILDMTVIPSQDLKALQKESESRKNIIPRHTQEDGLQYIGENIAFFSRKTLGHGSSAVVYEGRFGRFDPKPVAVKIIKCSNKKDADEIQTEIKNVYREILNMETLNKSKSPNVIEFIDSIIDENENIIYIAFELAKGTLHAYVDSSNASWQNALPSANVTRGIVDGLNYTHQKGIVHRDLKPANIFIVENSVTGLKAVIGDYGTAKATTGSTCSLTTGRMGSLGFIAPEIWRAMKKTADASGSRCSKQSDIFSLGLVIYFALSLGKHPYGNIITAQEEIEKKSVPNFEHIHSPVNAYSFIHMLRPMFNDNPTERSRIEEVSEHPALMSADKVMEFFVNKSDEFENQIKADPLKASLLEHPSLVTNKNWMNQLPLHIKTYLRSYTLKNRRNPLYQNKETSIRFLLRAVRNTKAHHTEYPKDVQTELGDFPDGHIALWLKVCPKLLMHVYYKLGPL